MTSRGLILMAEVIGGAVSCLTLPHTFYAHRLEVKTQEIHLTIKERLWLSAYTRHFFRDYPRWLWAFLDDALTPSIWCGVD